MEETFFNAKWRVLHGQKVEIVAWIEIGVGTINKKKL